MAETEDIGGASETYEYATERYSSARDAAKYWMAEIDASSKREKRWRDDAKDAAKIYDAGNSGNQEIRDAESSFNILHSNVETLVPALYNSTPTPDARPRNNRKDELARKASTLLEESLNYQVDTQDFDEKILDSIYDSEIAGRGICRVRYNPVIAPNPDEQTGEQIAFEETILECVPWQKFRRGPADSWDQLPWIGFEHSFSRDQLIELIVDKDEEDLEKKEASLKLAKAIPLDETTVGDKDGSREGVFKTARVWEVWDKETRTIIHIAPSYEESLLSVDPDPMQLLNFWPIPRPLQKKRRGKDRLTPICPFNVYKPQAVELEKVSSRILKLTEALKYRGIRAAELQELERVAVSEDGEFIASTEAMALLQSGAGLDKAIWVVPIDMLAQVLQQLIIMRESMKQTIYEVTGISDVLRGVTDAQETATAQGIKAQWGSLRIQKQQREVQRFVRDLFSIMSEIMANLFQPDTLKMMSGAEVTEQEIQLLQSDVQRTFRIDIETDSTIAGDVARMQQNMNGFMEGTGKFLQAVLPGVQSGLLPPPAAAEIFSAFAGTFRLGRRVEDVLSQVVQAAEQMPNPAEPKPEQKQAQQIALQKEASEVEENKATTVRTIVEAKKIAAETQVVGQQPETVQ